jgi:hypothetical protein
VTAHEPAVDLDVLEHPDVLDRFADLGIEHAPSASRICSSVAIGVRLPGYDSRI